MDGGDGGKEGMKGRERVVRGSWCSPHDLLVHASASIAAAEKRPLVNVYNRSVGGIRCFRDLQTSANYARKAEMK